MTTSSKTLQSNQLAIHGGEPAVKQKLPPMYPGGMRIDAEEEAAVLEVLRAKRLFRYYGPTSGPSRVAELEEAFARKMGTEYALAVASGTTALTSALTALGVGPGDEVIVPAHTWISTAAAVTSVGAVPIIAEVDESLDLDPADAEARITKATRAIIPVHMRGAPCDMSALKRIAEKHQVGLLEDAAQADGGSYHGQRLGSIGNVGAFSLQFNKILTAGEGGMVITSDRKLYERALMYHDVAASMRSGLSERPLIGINCRLTELQGALTLVQLGKLEGMLEAMRHHKASIKERVSEVARSKGVEFRRLNDPEGDTAIALIFYLPNAEQAEYAVKALKAEGVGAGLMFSPDHPDYHVYYHWTPILRKHQWASMGPWDWHEGEVEYSQEMCPRSLDLLGRAVQIHISPELTEEQVEEVSLALNKVLGSL